MACGHDSSFTGNDLHGGYVKDTIYLVYPYNGNYCNPFVPSGKGGHSYISLKDYFTKLNIYE